MESTEKRDYVYSPDEINLYEQWQKLKRRKKLIISVTLASIIVSIVITFILTPIYRSTAVIMPVYESNKATSSFINLAAMTGLGVGRSSEFKKIMAVLNSRTVKENVIKKLNLVDVLFEKKPENRNPVYAAVDKFKKNLNIVIDAKTDTIEISYYDKNPELAAKVVKTYIEEAQNILRNKALTVAKLNRIFIESQMKDVENRIKKLKNELAKYQKSTKLVAPNLQLNNKVRIYTTLLEEKIKTELEIKRLQATLSSSSPKIKILKQQLEDINKKIEQFKSEFINMPEKLVKYKEIVSSLRALENVYQMLVQMYEQAKLDETKKSLYIQVIDEPEVPDLPAKPNKKLIVSFTGIFAFVASIVLAFILEAKEKRKRIQE